MLNYSAIPVIVVICYVAVAAIKTTKINGKWLPLISCAIGALLAAGMFYVTPEFIGAASLTAAVISGAFSGLAATGTNQIFKQLMKAAENGEDLSKVDLKATAETVVAPESKTDTAPDAAAVNTHRTNDTGGNPGAGVHDIKKQK